VPAPNIWVAGHPQPIPLATPARGADLLALVKEEHLYRVNEQQSLIDDALELAAPINQGALGPAVAGAWAAVESLLSHPDDPVEEERSGKAVAADRLASIIACSWPRAELTVLSYRHSPEPPDDLARNLSTCETNLDHARAVVCGLEAGAALDVGRSRRRRSDQAAAERMAKLIGNPQRELAAAVTTTRTAHVLSILSRPPAWLDGRLQVRGSGYLLLGGDPQDQQHRGHRREHPDRRERHVEDPAVRDDEVEPEDRPENRPHREEPAPGRFVRQPLGGAVDLPDHEQRNDEGRPRNDPARVTPDRVPAQPRLGSVEVGARVVQPCDEGQATEHHQDPADPLLLRVRGRAQHQQNRHRDGMQGVQSQGEHGDGRAAPQRTDPHGG
jgi:hypothetical protein